MVSTLEKRLMINVLKSKHVDTKCCRLCHGPLMSPSPAAPPIRASSPTGEEVDCHPTCLPFACTGCVSKDRNNYGMLDWSNTSYDGQCALCVCDEEIRGVGWGGRVMLSSSP